MPIITRNLCDELRATLGGMSIAREASDDVGCAPMITPMLLIQLAINAMRDYFSSTHRTKFGPASFKWQAGDDTGLLIREGYPTDFSGINSRPAIFVNLGDIKLELPPSVLSGSKGNMVGYSSDGKAAYATIESSNWELRCIASTVLQSWALATEVKTFWQTFGHVMVSALNKSISEVMVSAVAKPQRPQGEDQVFVSTVIINLKWQDGWNVMPEELPIQHFVIDAGEAGIIS